MFAQLSEFIDGEADRDVHVAIETHMVDCARCEEFLISLRKTVELAKRAPRKPLPAHVKRSIHDAIRKCIVTQK